MRQDVKTEFSDKVRFCPVCGSFSVDFSELSGGAAGCNNCDWKGSLEDLFSVPFSHELGGNSGIIQQLSNELRGIVSGTLGIPYLKFLIKWGFVKMVNGNVDRVVFTRYLVVIARSILVSILEERKRISNETEHNKAANDVR
jgi:hypothetical protein